MHPSQFSALAARRFDACGEVMIQKSAEYSRQNDRLWNFKRAADMQGITPAEALRGMWAKHLVSVFDMIDHLALGNVPSQATCDEKIGDTINYTLLLEGLIEEARAAQQPVTTAELAGLEAEAMISPAAAEIGRAAATPRRPIPDECLGSICHRARL
ncbi:MAG: hypothetical protein EOL92_00535 [Bacteroidia bacterium]|nr:hypothetical protein [Bacteroidia bacterium]